MQKKKATPGEWKQHPTMPECVVFTDADGDMANLLTSNSKGYYCCENELDAQLISASKELLAVSEKVLKFLASVDRALSPYEQSLLIEAREAIKKAKGE